MTATDERLDEAPAAASGRRTSTLLLALIAVAALVVAVTGGWLWGSSGSSDSSGSGSALIAPGAVDKGFARDMATHHQQAVTMAAYVRDNSTDPAIRNLAYDIESSQSVQMGELIGWLAEWGVSRTTSTPMDWMPVSAGGMAGMSDGSMAGMPGMGDGLMPGMATPAQMNELLSAHGTHLDVLFLQLMIRHHEGGLGMADYAAAHARVPAVRALASDIAGLQRPEIVEMQKLLAARGGTPLPPPN